MALRRARLPSHGNFDVVVQPAFDVHAEADARAFALPRFGVVGAIDDTLHHVHHRVSGPLIQALTEQRFRRPNHVAVLVFDSRDDGRFDVHASIHQGRVGRSDFLQGQLRGP